MARIPSDDPKEEVKVTLEIDIGAAKRKDEIDSELASIALARAERPSNVAPLIAEAKEVWSERAAIREYVGGLPRWKAERYAVQDTGETMGLRYVPEKDLPASQRKPRQRAKR